MSAGAAAATLRPRYELECLSSFINWPSDHPTSPVVLANAGFRYTGYRDRVTCPVCGIEIEGWQTNRLSQPRDEHRSRSPMCSLAQACSSCSSQRAPGSSLPSAVGRQYEPAHSGGPHAGTTGRPRTGHNSTDTCPKPLNLSSMASINISSSNDDHLHSAVSAVSASSITKNNSPETKVDCTANREVLSNITTSENINATIIGRSIPDLNLLKVERSRLETYSNWPAMAPVNPSELAKTGLFYTGVNDRVRCVFCGGLLHHWTTDDVPASEHRRHFPDCPFIKGLDVGNVPLENKKDSLVKSAAHGAVDQIRNVSNQLSKHVTCNHDDAVAEATEDPTSIIVRQSLSAHDDQDEEQRLLAENRQLIEARTCKVCMDKMVDTVFLPCGHLVACQECAPKLKDCPVCRTYIRGTVKSFFS